MASLPYQDYLPGLLTITNECKDLDATIDNIHAMVCSRIGSSPRNWSKQNEKRKKNQKFPPPKKTCSVCEQFFHSLACQIRLLWENVIRDIPTSISPSRSATEPPRGPLETDAACNSRERIGSASSSFLGLWIRAGRHNTAPLPECYGCGDPMAHRHYPLLSRAPGLE